MPDRSAQPRPKRISAAVSAAVGVAMVAAVGVYAAYLTPRPDDADLPVGMPAADLGAAICLIGVLMCTLWLGRGVMRGRRRLWA